MIIGEYIREFEKAARNMPDIHRRAIKDSEITFEEWLAIDAAVTSITDAVYRIKDSITRPK